ncbi:hypothetical protein BEWA_019130 [Theileria equi strain WA]|uniref:Bromo domain-containing protein n=1 Tax=Theileria equi strain WA TaxID=1537102 RepID=L0AUZ8_THEEQ|nr:hypothetical protein BEWA_019130 [Theileria equi strain WA]AFZ79068.1 hypothetical protein BEWA_019130 [Theileria equi strain WA]|eukprot:XP_004828734.1 hypothetical protein BEWA_019130 [Theileria equi strain WA]
MESQHSWTKYCLDVVVKKMRGDRYGTLFASPVLEASDSIISPAIKENYRLVIQNPMDYKTVRTKLENNMYDEPQEFHSDMVLIYENCIKFNPPVGTSKWVHDAAKSNLKKYLKLWEQSEPTILAYFKRGPVVTHSAALTQEISVSDESKTYGTPKFRLNLQKIHEYKLRKGFINQPPQEIKEAVTTTLENDTPTVREFYDIDELDKTLLEGTPELPSIMSKQDNGILCVSWLSENECNRLFPNCSIIGLTDDKPSYNFSDVAIRCIYNQLYLSDLGPPGKLEHIPDESDSEPIVDHTLQQHNRIYFNISKHTSKQDIKSIFCMDENPNPIRSIFGVEETSPRKSIFNIKMEGKRARSDADWTFPSKKQASLTLNGTTDVSIGDRDPVCIPESTDMKESISTDLPEVHLDKFMDSEISSNISNLTSFARIELRMNSTISIDSTTEAVLKKNEFIKILNIGEFVDILCEPSISLLSSSSGFFKIDESEFKHRNSILKHIRLFLVNCAQVLVQVSKEYETLPKLVLKGKSQMSSVESLQCEAKIGNLKNLPFFQLPSAGGICYCADLDILWRTQFINNALPTPLLALHIILEI